ncbi:hypothetical protein PY730_27915 (plasmid) [Klebsiella pneumoniae]|nr:hypothetical protein PY730_27915 [Klebsiella pneumoniae]
MANIAQLMLTTLLNKKLGYNPVRGLDEQIMLADSLEDSAARKYHRSRAAARTQNTNKDQSAG